jgi:hypothetical protein
MVCGGGNELPPHAAIPIAISRAKVDRINLDGIIRKRAARRSLRMPNAGRRIAGSNWMGNALLPLEEFKEALVLAVLTVTVIVAAPLPAKMVDGVIVQVAPAGSPVNVSTTAPANVEPIVGDSCNV